MTPSPQNSDPLLPTLQTRFNQHAHRHPGLVWDDIQKRLEANPGKLQSLQAMEDTGGEPDVVGHDVKTGEIVFMDCSPESPKESRIWTS